MLRSESAIISRQAWCVSIGHRRCDSWNVQDVTLSWPY